MAYKPKFDKSALIFKCDVCKTITTFREDYVAKQKLIPDRRICSSCLKKRSQL